MSLDYDTVFGDTVAYGRFRRCEHVVVASQDHLVRSILPKLHLRWIFGVTVTNMMHASDTMVCDWSWVPYSQELPEPTVLHRVPKAQLIFVANIPHNYHNKAWTKLVILFPKASHLSETTTTAIC